MKFFKSDSKKGEDIKYLNIPNVCFSLTDKKDKREKEFSKQRIERGFDDSETWSLDSSIASFTVPRLKRFKEVNNGAPFQLNIEEWNIILDKMITSFELILENSGSCIWNEGEEKQVNEGLDLFRNYFFDLWW